MIFLLLTILVSLGSLVFAVIVWVTTREDQPSYLYTYADYTYQEYQTVNSASPPALPPRPYQTVNSASPPALPPRPTSPMQIDLALALAQALAGR